MIYGRSRIDKLEPSVKDRFLQAEADLLQLDFDVYITETRRPILVQIAYYAQGRISLSEVNEIRKAANLIPLNQVGGIVTNANGITSRSKHQDGRALDVVPYDPETNKLLWNASEGIWLQLGQIARKHGFQWGGDWKNSPAAVLGWDCPHWEI